MSKDLWASPPDFFPSHLEELPKSKLMELMYNQFKFEDYSEVIPGKWQCNGCQARSSKSGMIPHDDICPVHFKELEELDLEDRSPTCIIRFDRRQS